MQLELSCCPELHLSQHRSRGCGMDRLPLAGGFRAERADLLNRKSRISKLRLLHQQHGVRELQQSEPLVGQTRASRFGGCGDNLGVTRLVYSSRQQSKSQAAPRAREVHHVELQSALRYPHTPLNPSL